MNEIPMLPLFKQKIALAISPMLFCWQHSGNKPFLGLLCLGHGFFLMLENSKDTRKWMDSMVIVVLESLAEIVLVIGYKLQQDYQAIDILGTYKYFLWIIIWSML